MARFETERTRHFRSEKLDPADENLISNVEEFGWGIIHVRHPSAGPGWSYTCGVYDTCGKPEIIEIGLFENTAQFLLNEAADRLRKGVNLAEGRHRDLVGEVECVFRPVDRKWLRQLMGWGVWYHGGDDFPALQAIYPDRENRFPGEPGFDAVFQQPLLQSNAVETILERDLWASADPTSSLFDWKFPDPPHTRVFLSQPVHDRQETVTYVSHDIEDGAWQFLGSSGTAGKKPVISCLHHPIDNDRSLNELADLPLGSYAERDASGSPWTRYQKEAEPK